MSNDDYDRLIKETNPKSPVLKDCAGAFFVGGLICLIGEIIREAFLKYGFSDERAKAFVSLILIAITAILTGTGVFDKIAKFAGAGTIVPITGFANSVVSPAMEFKTEGRIMGTGANMFKIAGPVIVYGCSSAVLYGLLLYIFK
ncbi:MAG: stage V sporulation protein AC [Clostridia bacterium]|nr:stage V sporulation protein AC [Clostridia bacterium]